MTRKYESWAMIWTMCGRCYLADIGASDAQTQGSFLEDAETGFVKIGMAGAFEYNNPVGMTPQGKLTRQTLVLPVDTILDNLPIYVKVCEVVFLTTMSDKDYDHYAKLIESGESMKRNTRAASAGLTLVSSFPEK